MKAPEVAATMLEFSKEMTKVVLFFFHLGVNKVEGLLLVTLFFFLFWNFCATFLGMCLKLLHAFILLWLSFLHFKLKKFLLIVVYYGRLLW